MIKYISFTDRYITLLWVMVFAVLSIILAPLALFQLLRSSNILKRIVNYIPIIIILSGCMALPNKPIRLDITQKNIFENTEKDEPNNPIVKAFFLNGFNEVEIGSKLKEFGKEDIDEFFIWLVREPDGWLYPVSGGRILEGLFKKIKMDYIYLKDNEVKNEK